MDDDIKTNEKVDLLLGQNAQVIKNIYSLAYINRSADFSIQIITENIFEPILILNYEDILIGFNKEVCIINQVNCSLSKRIVLESPFTDLKSLPNLTTLIIFETGIICLDYKYNEKWNFYKDVLQDYKLYQDQNKISLNFMDSGFFNVDLITGKQL